MWLLVLILLLYLGAVVFTAAALLGALIGALAIACLALASLAKGSIWLVDLVRQHRRRVR